MNHYRVDADKLMGLFVMLHQGNKSTKDMADTLQVSMRTISRLINVLEDIFDVRVEWEWTEGRKKVIYHITDYGVFDKSVLDIVLK